MIALAIKSKQVTIEEVARAAAKEALKQQKNEERLRIKKNRFHNTELLLKNYLNLMSHIENSKDKVSDILNLEDLDLNEISIRAIKRSKLRTAVMTYHIESCMNQLKQKQIKKDQEAKYEVLYSLYLDPTWEGIEWGSKIATLAEQLHCSQDSIRRWRKEMINELSIFLFGVDGLKLEV